MAEGEVSVINIRGSIPSELYYESFLAACTWRKTPYAFHIIDVTISLVARVIPSRVVSVEAC